MSSTQQLNLLSICTVKYHAEFSEGLPSSFLKSGTQHEFQFDSPHDLDPLLYKEDNTFLKESEDHY